MFTGSVTKEQLITKWIKVCNFVLDKLWEQLNLIGWFYISSYSAHSNFPGFCLQLHCKSLLKQYLNCVKWKNLSSGSCCLEMEYNPICHSDDIYMHQWLESTNQQVRLPRSCTSQTLQNIANTVFNMKTFYESLYQQFSNDSQNLCRQSQCLILYKT